MGVEQACVVALGTAPVAQRFDDPVVLLGDRLKGVYRLLAGHGATLFPDEYFADWGSPAWVDTARMGVRARKEPDGYEETVQRGVQTRRG